jgi:Holliday junction DNA helicase RuvB
MKIKGCWNMDERQVNDINDCRPQVIEQFCGQSRVVERCKVALSAAWNLGTPLPHTILQSGAGLGKTELAHILAKEMGSELHEQLAQNLKDPKDLHAFLLTPNDREVVLIDEIHELPPLVQTTLYRAMENQQIFLESHQGKKSRPVKIANFTILGATTDPQRLLQPLRDRFKMVLDLSYYSVEELEGLLRNRVRQLGWNIDDAVPFLCAQRGKGIPRIALRLLSSVRMTASAQDSDRISVNHFEQTCELEGIDPIGLNPTEIQYMKILLENDGSCRLNILASRLGLHLKHVSSLIEDFPIRSGLVTKSNSVRILTQKGLDHVKTYHSKDNN